MLTSVIFEYESDNGTLPFEVASLECATVGTLALATTTSKSKICIVPATDKDGHDYRTAAIVTEGTPEVLEDFGWVADILANIPHLLS